MKTAMQELFDTMKQKGQFIPEYIKKDFLEKEKQQIKMTFTDSRWDGKFKNMTSEEYYNQNYNQNK